MSQITLEEISQNAPLALLDTCSISENSIKNNLSKSYLKFLEEVSQRLNESIPLINNFERLLINKEEKAVSSESHLYITEGVREELLACNFNYSKKIKRCKNGRQSLDFWRLLKKYLKMKRHLAELFFDSGHVLDLKDTRTLKRDDLNSNFQDIDEINKKYSSFMDKYHPLMETIGLSEVDKDFLITGLTMSKYQEIWLVSNDFHHILKARDRIFGRTSYSPSLKFYFRTKDGYFKKIR